MAINPNMANREVCDCQFLDYKTREPFLFLDVANTTTLDMTGNSVFAYGGRNRPPRVQFTGEKGGTIKIETQITPAKFFSLLTGAGIEKSATFMVREELVVGASGSITLGKESVVGTVYVYAANDDCGTPLAVTGSGASMTVTGAKEKDTVIAYYWTEKSTGIQKLNIKSTTFPKAFVFQGSTYDKTEDDEIIAEKMIAYKCVPQSTFTIARSNSGDPASITLTCDMLADKDDNILDLIYDEDGE